MCAKCAFFFGEVGIAPLPELFIFLFDLEMDARRVIEDEVDIQRQKIRQAPVERFLDLLFMLMEKVHGPVKMLKLEGGTAPVDLLQPAFVTAEFGLRGKTPVGDHEEDRPFEKFSGFIHDDFIDPQVRPHLLENIERPVLPGVLERPAGVEKIRDGVLFNTADELFETIIGALVGVAQGAEDTDLGPLFFRVPDVFVYLFDFHNLLIYRRLNLFLLMIYRACPKVTG